MTAHTNGQAPPGWSARPTDLELCDLLMAADVTASERTWLDLMHRRIAEHGGKCAKNARDKLVALAQAKGVLAAKPKSKEPAGPVSAPGDYSVAKSTAGHAIAKAMLYDENGDPKPIPMRPDRQARENLKKALEPEGGGE